MGANTSFDARALSHASLRGPDGLTPGDALAGVPWLDVLVLSRAERATRQGHDLKSLTQEVLGRRDMTFKEMRVEVFGPALTKKGKPYADGRPAAGELDEERCLAHPAFRAYSLADARNAYDLMLPLLASLERQSPRARAAFERLVQPQSRLAFGCESRGLPVDLGLLRASGEAAERDLAAVYARLNEWCPGVLWTSPAQVKVALHGAGLPVEATDVATLTHLRDVLLDDADERRAFVSDILDARAADKQLAAFFRRLPLGVHEGRVHPSLRVSGTITGRDACAGPNLQQVSATKDRWGLRRAFCYPTGGGPEGRLLVVCDYSAIEWVLAMHASGDEAMLRAHAEGLDPHAYTAAGVFAHVKAFVAARGGISKASLKAVKAAFPRERQSSKTLNYASLYGSGPHTLSAQLLASGVRVPATRAAAEAEYDKAVEAWFLDGGFGDAPAGPALSAEEMLAGWCETYSGYDRWRKELCVNIRNACVQGGPAEARGVVTGGGRLRQADERAMLLHNHPDRELRARYKAECRGLVSSAIQGFAADLLHRAELMVNDDTELRAAGYRLLLPCHDELVGDAPGRTANKCVRRVKRLMVQAATELGIKPRVEASGGFGYSWATAK